MEQVNKLIEQVNTLKKWADQAMNATERSEVDQAKVEGLRTYQETLRQVNRAYHDLKVITADSYSRISAQNLKNARALVSKPAEATVAPSEPEEVKVEVKPKATKTAKKSTKKAKK